MEDKSVDDMSPVQLKNDGLCWNNSPDSLEAMKQNNCELPIEYTVKKSQYLDIHLHFDEIM